MTATPTSALTSTPTPSPTSTLPVVPTATPSATPISTQPPTIAPRPSGVDLSVNKTVSNSRPRVGQTVTFTITVRNLGTSTATGVVIRERPHSSLILDTVTPSQGSYAAGRWNLGTLAPGASATLSVRARVTSRQRVPNTAEVLTLDQADRNSANNRSTAFVNPPNASANPTTAPLPPTATAQPATATLPAPTAIPPTPTVTSQGRLEITKQVDRDAVLAGQPVTFNITVRNAGPGTATSVVVTDRVPSAFSIVEATSSHGQTNVADRTVTLLLPSLDPGQTVTITIIAIALDSANGTITNTAVVEAAFGQRAVSEADDAVVALTRQPGLARSGAMTGGVGTLLSMLGTGLLCGSTLLLGIGMLWRRRRP